MSGRVNVGGAPVFGRRRLGASWWDVLPLPDRRPAYAGYLGLLFFTFVIITYYLPGAEFAAVVAALSVTASLLFGRTRLRFGVESGALVAVLGLAALSLRDPLDPLWASQRAGELAKITLVFLASIHLLNSARRVAAFATIWFGLFLLFPVRGTLVNYARGYRIRGRGLWNYVWENPNDLAAGALITAAIGGALLYVFHRGPTRLGILVGLALTGVVILLSGSRGVFLGTVCAALVLVWHSRRRIRAPVVAASCLILGLAVAPQPIRDRLWTLGRLSDPEAMRSYDAGSVKERLEIWKTAFAIIGDHPVWGIGVGAFPIANQEYATRLAEYGIAFGRAAVPRQDAHSTYLTAWAELGTVGLVAYCALLGAAWYRLRAVRRRWRQVTPRECASLAVLEAGLIGYLVACFWATYTALTLPYLFLALCIAWAAAVDNWARSRQRAVVATAPETAR